MKSPDYAGDRDDKDLLRSILWVEFGIAAVEPLDALLCLDGSHIWPDLETTNYFPTTYFELHGPYHNDVKFTSDYTYKKFMKYQELKVGLVEIWSDTDGNYSREDIIEVLRLKKIKDLRF